MTIRTRIERLERHNGVKRYIRSFREVETADLVALLKALGYPVTRGPDGLEDISDADLEKAAEPCPACDRLGDTCDDCRAEFQRACDSVGLAFLGDG